MMEKLLPATYQHTLAIFLLEHGGVSIPTLKLPRHIQRNSSETESVHYAGFDHKAAAKLIGIAGNYQLEQDDNDNKTRLYFMFKSMDAIGMFFVSHFACESFK